MKHVAYFHGIPVYSSELVEGNVVWLINEEAFDIAYPKRKDGKLDMRFSINKMKVIFDKYR